jgi:nitrite reductase/ring-hydroxylating ferredoxin subunit
VRGLGSFIVNTGHHSKIPRGEMRIVQIGATSIAVFHTSDGNVYATDHGHADDSDLKTYPALIDQAGDILIGVETVSPAKRRRSMSLTATP